MNEIAQYHQYLRWKEQKDATVPRFELWRGGKCIGYGRSLEEAEATRKKLELQHNIYGVEIKEVKKEA